jgi:three-Cys-motif partner protein
MPLIPGTDGLPVRSVRQWNDEKLWYVQRYIDIFTTGMRNRWRRLVYADFFSGPGRCLVEGEREVDGSPLLAASRPEFKQVFLNDLDPRATDALKMRLEAEPLGRILVETQDCNDAVPAAREFLFPNGSGRGTLGLAFIDPTDYAMRFDSIADLTRDVNLDILITFMTGFTRRFLLTEFRPGSSFDEFMGTREWLRLQEDATPQTVTRQLLDIYRSQLGRIGYLHVDDSISVENTRRRYIYHLVYASRDPKGLEFWQKIRGLTSARQRRLL